MIETYYINVTQFEDESLFQEKLHLLSPYRQQKIALLKHKKDKNRSLGVGLALNRALENYGITEQRAEYEFGEWGKPSFKYYQDIHFSLSHSGDYAICSIGDRPVGNDIELIRQGRLKVADRFFAKAELDWMYAVQDGEEATGRMFRIWTMKESFLKITGRGISLPLADFAVVVDEGSSEVHVKHNYNNKRYCMKEYPDVPGYCTAVCYEEGEEPIRRMIAM